MQTRSDAGSMSNAELGELIGAFNEVTSRLQSSHEALRAEVSRLRGELSEANAQVARSQRLAALGEMAAGIAHEVRNPLGSIRLYARMLVQDLGDRPAERGLAERIDAATRTVDAIVQDVLTFSREFRVRRDVTEVSSLLTRVLESCQHDGVPGWKQVEVVRDVDEGLVVDCDQSLMHQAMVNVVRNAYEAMAECPGRRHELRVLARSGGDGVVLGVEDTGPGVSPEVEARMFNPFFTTRHTGTGLGLAIVHRIVDAHGGRIRVRNNQPGHGARVEIEIPAAAGTAGGQPARQEAVA
ncbi:MAG: GHKL domain-containing protein [Leptolyngbya sp. PLA1]|nr:GHKL domain-containing protein [Leptolyngbya sp. PLA1]